MAADRTPNELADALEAEAALAEHRARLFGARVPTLVATQRSAATLLRRQGEQLDTLTESSWAEYRLEDASGAFRLIRRQGEFDCWSIDDARSQMAPYHHPGDGFEVVEYRCSRLSGPVVSVPAAAAVPQDPEGGATDEHG